MRSFYKEAQKSPFKAFPWKQGTMHFHYVPQVQSIRRGPSPHCCGPLHRVQNCWRFCRPFGAAATVVPRILSWTCHANFRCALSVVAGSLQEAGTDTSPLAALLAHRRVLGVVGLLYCPAVPDIAKAYAAFEKQCRWGDQLAD